MHQQEEENIRQIKILLQELLETSKRTEILIRVNNLVLSKFILQLAQVRKDLGLPKRQTFFKFELLDEDYEQLVKEFGKEETNKALYRLDRMLLQNKLNCPHNIKKYISNRIKRKKE